MTEAAKTLDIAGHWKSVAPEPMGQFWALREFVIDRERWQVAFKAFADEAATLPLFTLDVGGVYVIGEPSETVPGAFSGIFPATHRHVIIDSDAGVGLFGQMGAKVSRGERRVLLNKGLTFVPALMDAMGEYDLVALRSGRLFFGDRSGDLTKSRPLALTPFPLARA